MMKAYDLIIIGGGPAGLSAAATAAKRGHRVTLFESCDILGGQLYLASLPPKKEEIYPPAEVPGTQRTEERCRDRPEPQGNCR